MIGINQFTPYFLGFILSYAFGNLIFALSCIFIVLININRIKINLREYYSLIFFCVAGIVMQLFIFGVTQALIKDLILVWCIFLSLVFFGSISYERKYLDTSKLLDFTLIILSIYYFLGNYILGYSSLELTKVFFPQSSYHYIATTCLFLVGFSYAFEGKITYRSLVLLVMLNIFLEGRTGIAISIGLIFLKFLTNRTNNTSELLQRLIIIFILYLFLSNYLLGLLFSIGDFSYKGASSTARDLMSLCYFNLLTFQDYIYGFDASDYYFCYEIFFSRPATESSFLQAISNLGIFAYPAFIFLAYKIFSILRKNFFAGGILLCMAFRFSTGDFLFFTPYDPLFFSLILLFDRNIQADKTKQSQTVS